MAIRSILSLLLLVIVHNFSLCAQSPHGSWELIEVTCHEVGAVLTFQGEVQANGEILKYEVVGVPEDVDVDKTQIFLPDGVRLVSIEKTTAPPDVADDLARMAKQMEAQQLALELEMALLSAIDQECAYLEANRNIGGQQEVLLVDDVEEMRHYLAERHKELALNRVDVASNVRHLEAQLSKVEGDFHALETQSRQPNQVIQFTVAGHGKGEARLQVATQLAGWVSSYDIYYDDRKENLQIRRFAKVIQKTGQPWLHVELKLRTGQPVVESLQNALQSPLQIQDGGGSNTYFAGVRWVNSGLSDLSAGQELLAGRSSMFCNWSFNAEDKVNISGNGEVARVFIDEQSAQASFHLEAYPSALNEAIWVCDTRDWMSLHMLSGEIRVFQGNAMVGFHPFNVPSWGDSMQVQLGFADGIRVRSDLLRDEIGKQLISGKRKVDQIRRVAVQNEGTEETVVRVNEQVSTASGCKVDVEASNGGVWDAETGEITWSSVAVPAEGLWEAEVRIRMTCPKIKTSPQVP